jgi:hypothetical protein
MATIAPGDSGVGCLLRAHRSRTLDPAGNAPHQQISSEPPDALDPQSAHLTLAQSALARIRPPHERHA